MCNILRPHDTLPARRKTTRWRKSSQLMNFGPGLINQSSDVNQQNSDTLHHYDVTNFVSTFPLDCRVRCFGRDNVILFHMEEQWQQTTKETFFQRQLCRAVREKRPDVNNAIILHDNARPHTARNVKQHLDRWDWEVQEHPPCYPNLSPCVILISIPKWKNLLRGRRFRTRDNTALAVNHEM